MGINEEKINKNYLLWQTKLEENECFSQKLIDNFGDNIRIASYGTDTKSGAAYEGSLIMTILWKICKNAININNLLAEEIRVDKKSLLKVCLLQHISKSVIYKKETSANKISYGNLYQFNGELGTSLKSGERSVLMCLQSDIGFTDEEYEAMKILDKEETQLYYSSLLSNIVKMANILTNTELKHEIKIKK